MEVEAGRCRRTDGKKWRCRWAVLPHQKYCERHIHRGRLRSRKPVEVDKTLSTKPTTPSSPLNQTQSATKTNANAINQNKVHIKNQSFKIKKLNRESALEFSFSPKGVVRDGNGCGTWRNERCRRTDGKKWQCRKDVIPGQKYCMQHMHRGAKNTNTALSLSSSKHQPDDDGSDPNGGSGSGSSSSEATA